MEPGAALQHTVHYLQTHPPMCSVASRESNSQKDRCTKRLGLQTDRVLGAQYPETQVREEEWHVVPQTPRHQVSNGKKHASWHVRASYTRAVAVCLGAYLAQCATGLSLRDTFDHCVRHLTFSPCCPHASDLQTSTDTRRLPSSQGSAVCNGRDTA